MRICRNAQLSPAAGHTRWVRSDPSADWTLMCRNAPGRSVTEVEAEYRQIIARHGLLGIDDFVVKSTARVMVDPRWAIHHPASAVAFAWRHRQRHGFMSALRAILRPRFAG
jgi:hypothetical protein